MQMQYSSIFNHRDFNKIYKKTEIPGVFYLNIKSPLAAQFELTSGCNQKCIFCYNVWKDGCKKIKTSRLSKRLQLKILDKLIDNEIFDLIFSGGEPLMVSWLEDLVKKASDNKIKTSIITNALLLDKKRALDLKKAGLVGLQISLHHYNSRINDKLTGNKGAFNKTVSGIKNAIAVFGEDKVNVNMVALPSTYKEVYSMAKFLHSIGVSSFSVATPTATGEMGNNKKLVIDKKMFLDIFEQLRNAKKDFGISVGFTGGFPMCILPKINPETIAMIGNYCDAGLNQLVVDPEGNLKPCVCLDEKLGNILNDDMKTIWNKNRFLINIRQLKFLPFECSKCKYLSMCRGGCRASAKGYFGKINARDPLMQ